MVHDSRLRLKELYVVSKVLDSGSDGTVYQARDEVTDCQFVVRQMLAEDTAGREPDGPTRQYQEVLATISSFDHPGLPRLRDHFREDGVEFVVTDLEAGVSLETVVRMSVKELPETQVVEWALQICDIMEYLHGRPSPFVLSALTARRFMVLPTGRLKLINLGLERCFGSKPRAVFARSDQDRYRDFVSLGHLLYYLVTRQSVPSEGLAPAPSPGVSPRLYKVIQRCLKQEIDPSFRSWWDVKQALEAMIDRNGEPAELASTGAPEPHHLVMKRAPPRPRQQWVDQAVFRVLSQPLAWLAGEALLLSLAVLIGYVWLHPGLTYEKSGAITYVASGDSTLLAIDPVSSKIVDRIQYEGGAAIVCVRSVLNGRRLLVMDSAQSRIYVLDTSTNHNTAQIAVEASPTQLVISPEEKMAYCLHPRRQLITQIDLGTFGVSNIFVTASTPQSLAVSPDGDTLYVAMTRPDVIVAMRADTGKVLGTVAAPHKIGPMALTQDGRQLWMAAADSTSLVVYDLGEDRLPNEIASVADIGGKGATRVMQSADGLEMRVLCRDSASIAVLKVQDYSVHPATPLNGGTPGDCAFVQDPPRLWIAEPDADRIVLFDLANNRVLKKMSIKQPNSITLAP